MLFFLKHDADETEIIRQVWIHEVRQARATYAFLREQAPKASTRYEKDALLSISTKEKYNIWAIDPTEDGDLRRYILNDENHQERMSDIIRRSLIRSALPLEKRGASYQ